MEKAIFKLAERGDDVIVTGLGFAENEYEEEE